MGTRIEKAEKVAGAPARIVKKVAEHDATSFGWQLACLVLAEIVVRHGEALAHAAGLVS